MRTIEDFRVAVCAVDEIAHDNTGRNEIAANPFTR